MLTLLLKIESTMKLWLANIGAILKPFLVCFYQLYLPVLEVMKESGLAKYFINKESNYCILLLFCSFKPHQAHMVQILIGEKQKVLGKF